MIFSLLRIFESSPAPFHDEPWLKQTTAVHTERFLIFQDITRDISQTKFYNLLSAFDFEREIIISSLVTLLCLLMSFVFVKLLRDANFRLSEFRLLAKLRYVRKLFRGGFKVSTRCFIEHYFAVLFGFQLWASIVLLTSNIRTNKLVVDSSGVIKNTADIFTTNRTACYLENDIEHTLALTSPNNSLLTRIYHEKTKLTKPMAGLRNKRIKDRCIIEKSIDNADFHVDDAFGVVGEQMAYVLLRGLSDIKSKNIIWVCQNEVYSLNFHIYHLNSPQYLYYDKM